MNIHFLWVLRDLPPFSDHFLRFTSTSISMPSRRFLWLHNGVTQLARFPISARLCLRFAHAFTRGIARKDQGVSWSNLALHHWRAFRGDLGCGRVRAFLLCRAGLLVGGQPSLRSCHAGCRRSKTLPKPPESPEGPRSPGAPRLAPLSDVLRELPDMAQGHRAGYFGFGLAQL